MRKSFLKKLKMEQKKLKSIIESLLFISGEPIKVEKLAKIAGATLKQTAEAARELISQYQEKGLKILEKDGSFQMVSLPENKVYLDHLIKSDFQEDLSRAALETLAIVAYRGPVSRAQMEEIRGINSSFILRRLLIRGLIEKIDNPQDARSYLYRVAFDFLKRLSLEKVKDLPQYEELSKSEII